MMAKPWVLAALRWLNAGVVGLVLAASELSAAEINFFPALIPTHIALHDQVANLEFRLYPPQSRVIVTPECPGLTFTPAAFVFDADTPVVTGVTLEGTAVGAWTVEYTAIVMEGTTNTSASLAYDTTALNVLSPPVSYAVGDEQWSGIVLHNDSFDLPGEESSSSPLWSAQNHGFASSACGAADGSKALYFTALGDRSAITAPLDLSGFTAVVHFFHAYGFESVQRYNDIGSNLIACEQAEEGEEVVFAYLPAGNDAANESAWVQLHELPRGNIAADDTWLGNSSAYFTSNSIVLPQSAMHANAQFRWRQKTHSSFPIDTLTGTSAAGIVAAGNDYTSVRGELGLTERLLWRYRNLFDQWMLDNVQFEVRLNPPQFTVASTSTGEHTRVLVRSLVPESWVEWIVGDGTHDFPTCESSSEKLHRAEVALTKSGYVHAVSCLLVNGLLATSFQARSPRIEIQATAPTLTVSVDLTPSIDVWIVELDCKDCEFMRYTLVDAGSEIILGTRSPSCSFGTAVTGPTGTIQVSSNAIVQVVACGSDLLQSVLVTSEALVVHPRAPTFSYTTPTTTVSGLMELIIHPPLGGEVGVVYSIGSNRETLHCPANGSSLSSSDVNITVKVFDVVLAISCCLSAACNVSEMSSWGPVDVQAVSPRAKTECSRVEPRTVVVTLEPVTLGAGLWYQVGPPASTLTCSSGIEYNGPVPVNTSTSMFAVSCLDGLSMSDRIEVAVVVDGCCAGRDSFQYTSCDHVLLMEDDFRECLSTTKWTKMTSQWGGSDVNGGVHADNVHCTADPASVDSKLLLDLEAHGDLYAGVSPVGKRASDSELQDRTAGDMYLEWALDGVSPPPCNELERCAARRVGSAVTTKLELNAGVFIVKLKPCGIFGTLTQVWWGSYETREEDGFTFQEIPFLPLWKSALYQSKTTPAAPLIMPSASSGALVDSTEFVEVVMQWNATEGRANLYVEGELIAKQHYDDWMSMGAGALSIGVWFPNSVAGTPLFSTCHVLVDQVRVFHLEITGGRWCEFESVQNNAVSCISDADCSDWVHSNCFMDIYEAVCVRNASSTADEEGSGDSGNEDGPYDTAVSFSTSDDGSETVSSSSTGASYFCQFRLQPLAQTSVSITEATTRNLKLDWTADE